ncbi:hypothetical protein SLEP1_g13723 [Rubroshorea leprosula]|uniref:DDE Tnp4 domain-containing protein n=1 Tax=Rubroshorea leprosula TaxID=152421 RepID=A0AAV5IPT9_9ROSI|nr:hypothetical protein SLEP1_g13723 [Rubroshorea leprosula]
MDLDPRWNYENSDECEVEEENSDEDEMEEQAIEQRDKQVEGETISRKFQEVLDAMVRFSSDIVKPPDYNFTETPNKIRQDSTFWPHFKGCIGAIDVTGWPGSTHDAHVLTHTLANHKDVFPYPPDGKYYLVDAGYPNINGYLAPYKGERYHIPDFRRRSQPIGYQEVFNHAHACLRNVIERSIGCWKNRHEFNKLVSFLAQDFQLLVLEGGQEIVLTCATMEEDSFGVNHAGSLRPTSLDLEITNLLCDNRISGLIEQDPITVKAKSRSLHLEHDVPVDIGDDKVTVSDSLDLRTMERSTG